jgi:hypothetical protein
VATAPLVPDRIESWTPARRAIDPWLVLRLCRYRRRAEVAPAIWDVTVRMAANAEALVTPVARLRALRVRSAGAEGAVLDGDMRFSGRAVGGLLDGSSLAVAFVLSLGPALEAEAAALGERHELLEAFLLDTAGWAALEVAVRALRVDLAARARADGARLTHRLAPGYRDWPLAEQPRLLALLDGPDPPARLSPHGVLVPFKSLTGLFGVRPGMPDR